MSDEEPAHEIIAALTSEERENLRDLLQDRKKIKAILRFADFMIMVGHVISVTARGVWAFVKFVLSGMMLVGGAVAAWAAIKGKWPW